MTNNIRPFVDTADLEPQLESAVWSVVSEPIDMDAVERVRLRAAGLSVELHQSVRPAMWRTTYQRRMVIMASLAAGILLVLGATILVPTNSSAFAAVIEELKAAGAFRYTRLIYTDQQTKPIEIQVMVADDGRERSNSPSDTSIMDATGRMRLTLLKSQKVAIVPEQRKKSRDMGQRQLEWLNRLTSHEGEPDRALGAKTLDGRIVNGFVVDQGQHEFTIWVDSKSNELVQIEHDGMVEGSPISKTVMKDFRFNETFDESLFSFEIPDDYKVMELPPAPELLPGEESIIEALRGYTDLADGKFPNSIVNWGEWAVFLAQSGKSIQETTAITARLGSILPFLTAMSKDDYEYLGAGKSIKDARTIVFWHRTKDGDIRAIYNDLTAATIDASELPASK